MQRDGPSKALSVVGNNWDYLILLVALALVLIGLISSYGSKEVVSHFGSWSIQQAENGELKTLIVLSGQYKSSRGGFVAGEEISIFLAMKFNDEQVWKEFNAVAGLVGRVIVENSERIDDYRKDLPVLLQKHGFDSIIVTQATLVLTLDSTNRVAEYNGKVVFTEAGCLSLGSPLDFFMKKYKLTQVGLDIAPRYVQNQINANKRVELASFIALAIGCLAIFFEIHGRRKGK